jgi:hypothetical protein
MEAPRPQILAEAIVAYALNNRTNLLPWKDYILFLAIMMGGTSPISYKLIVKSSLGTAVQTGSTISKSDEALRSFFPA